MPWGRKLLINLMCMPCRGRKAFQDICSGLYALHSNGICHMDMKTPNCLLFDDGLCKISDLGQGKILQGDRASITAESQGTLAWMAPEQMLGRVGLGSDIWALSVILHEVSPISPVEHNFTSAYDQVLFTPCTRPFLSLMQISIWFHFDIEQQTSSCKKDLVWPKTKLLTYKLL